MSEASQLRTPASRVRSATVRILVVGAAGMLGGKLADRLARDGTLGATSVSHLLLADVVAPTAPADAACEVETLVADLTDPETGRRLVAGRPDVVFHLAAVVSAEAEADPEKGHRVNVEGTKRLLDAVREAGSGYCPRVVFSSSIAVFGPPFPDAIGDDQAPAPLTSYGTQKAIAELLLADYTRRGYLDGVGIRLPTICVRPGAPNLAASSFFSSIIREPLNGSAAVLPVPTTVRHWFASPRAGVEFLVHAAGLESSLLGDSRSVTMPGVSATVGEELEALRRVGGEDALALVRPEPDETTMRIVAGWPGRFDARRAHALGFRAEANFEEIVRVYVEDELAQTVAAS
jgi:D-erythronate 2-dehydrogenase